MGNYFTEVVPVQDWLRWVTPQVSACPTELALSAIRDAMRHFCSETRAWRLRYPPVILQAGQQEFQLLDIPCGAVLHEVLNLSLNERSIFPAPVSNTPADDIRVVGHTTGSVHWSRTGTNVITFNRPIAQGGRVEMEIIVKPSENTQEVPIELYEQHRELITQKAVAILKMMVEQPWTDLNLGASLETLYNRGLVRVKTFVQDGNAHVRHRTRAYY